MLMVPKEFAILMTTFVALFTRRVSQHVEVLLVGAILTPDQRTVTASLRVMGLAHTKSFRQYHRVLNRAVWSSLAGVRLLLLLLVSVLAPDGPLVMGLDDTLERRWGVKIKAKGIPRSGGLSHSHMVKASGLRWLSLMLLVPMPWAKRVWALPFLTVLAPSDFPITIIWFRSVKGITVPMCGSYTTRCCSHQGLGPPRRGPPH